MLFTRNMDASTSATDPVTAVSPDKTAALERRKSDVRRKNSDVCSSTISLDMLPVHPIRCMQGPFEESIMESAEPLANEQLMKLDAEARRRQLLDAEDEDPQQQHSRWHQRPDAKFHPLWKLVAQITFGFHLIHKKLARSDSEVTTLLQQHVDEVDGFIEDNTADFDLAIRDIDERIHFLSLPFEHNKTFNRMLCDRNFRTAIIDGNDIIARILARTREAMNASLDDISRGNDATHELAKFLQKLESSIGRDQQLLDIFIAMRGNAEGWRRCFRNLGQKATRLKNLMLRLEEIVDEIAKRAGMASRRKTPTGVLGMKNRPDNAETLSTCSASRNSGELCTRDKPLPPEPPKKMLSTRSAKVHSTPLEVSQPTRAASVNANPSQSSQQQPSSSSQRQSQQQLALPSRPQHTRGSKSLSVSKPSGPKNALNVTFAKDVKSPGPSTPNIDPPAPRRRSRSQKRYSNEVELGPDHMATAALIDRTSATPLTPDSERRPSLLPDQHPPSSAYMQIGLDEELISKDVGDRPASSSIDVLFDGQERTPREEIALVLKGLGHDLHAFASAQEDDPSPAVSSISLRSPLLPSPSVFTSEQPFWDEASSDNFQPDAPELDPATSSSREQVGADDAPSSNTLFNREAPLAPKKELLPLLENHGERMAIQTTPDSIPLDDIPLSIEAFESIRSAEEEEADGTSEIQVYHFPPKLVELSPITESTIAEDEVADQAQHGSSSLRDTETLTSSSADDLLLRHSEAGSPRDGNRPTRRGSDSSSASRRPRGERVSGLVDVYTHLDMKKQKDSNKSYLPQINTSKPLMSLSPVPEAVDSEDTSAVQEPPELKIDDAEEAEDDEDSVSPTTQKPPTLEVPTTPRDPPSKLPTTSGDGGLDFKRLEPWDHRDSIMKTPPGYVRRGQLDYIGGNHPEDSLERPSSFYLNPSRESSVASVIEPADEALCNAVTVPLPASRPGSSIAIPRILIAPDHGQEFVKPFADSAPDQLRSPDSYGSTETLREVKVTELTSAPPVPAMDLKIDLTASPTGGTRVQNAGEDTQFAQPLRSTREMQSQAGTEDSEKIPTSSMSDPSETIRVAVDMMPAFWPGQDRDSLLLDIGLLPGRDMIPQPNTPVELPETKDGPRIPVEMDQEEPSRRLGSRKLPKLETSMATTSSWRNVVESDSHSGLSSGGSSSTFTVIPPRSNPRSPDYTDTSSHSGQGPASAVKGNISRVQDEARLSVKTIRSEPDLRASANLDNNNNNTTTTAADENHTGSNGISQDGSSRVSPRPDSQSTGSVFQNPGLSQSSSPTVASPGPSDDRSQRPSLISPNSEAPVFTISNSALQNGKRLMAKPSNGSTTTLPSYLDESSLHFAKTLYIPPTTAAVQEPFAGEEAEINDETTALPRMLTSPEMSTVKRGLSFRRPNMNHLKGLSQRSINPFLKKAFTRKGATSDSRSLNAFVMS